jgi:hypothetical protein
MQARARGRASSRRRSGDILQVVVHVAALLPLAVMIWDGLNGNLTINPIQ